METGQLKTLLDKYFEGLTNLKEEQTLLDYFSGDVGDLPGQVAEDQDVG